MVRPTDVLYVINFILFFINMASSLTLIRMSFLNLITVIVMISVSALSFLLLLTIKVVSSTFSLPLADMIIVCVYAVVLCTQ
jgi:hypothetical protein